MDWIASYCNGLHWIALEWNPIQWITAGVRHGLVHCTAERDSIGRVHCIAQGERLSLQKDIALDCIGFPKIALDSIGYT